MDLRGPKSLERSPPTPQTPIVLFARPDLASRAGLFFGKAGATKNASEGYEQLRGVVSGAAGLDVRTFRRKTD